MMSAQELRKHDLKHPPIEQEPPEPLVTFCQRHGGNPLKSESRWLFADGAEVHHSEFSRPQQIEPPDDPRQRIFARREYHLGKLGRAQDDFRRLKNALQGTGAAFNWDKDEYGDPPSDTDPYTGYPDGRVALRRLQGIVLKHREALAGIDAEIAALPGSKQGQERREVNEELDRQQSEREHARQAEIAAIEI